MAILGDLARLIRSKNAGPFMLTFDVMFEDEAQGKASARDHRRLLEHIRNRDAANAQKLILKHMERARSYWGAVLGDKTA